MNKSRSIAVTLHDVEPATFETSRKIRNWLASRRIDRVTLLAIPARRNSQLDHYPETVRWLREGAAAGDAIAQHGFRHQQVHRLHGLRQWIAGLHGEAAAEFVGLSGAETREAVRAGRRILVRAGLRPRGFVAPAYAYTAALRGELAITYEWWPAS
jgi:predicted deacetylase